MEIFLKIVEILKDLGPVIIAVVAICLTYRHHKHSRKITNDKMQMELHTKFSDEFEELLPNLLVLIDSELPENNPIYGEDQEAINTLTIRKYFNLCAEEFYWYKRGRIDQEVWNSWRNGMNDFYSMSPLMQELWEDNSKNGGYKAYYLKSPTDLFDPVNVSDEEIISK
ncbi:hypothetical protein [Nonlabens sp. Asnod3-A02]|uniref:hypothetical protein n=1 Tax=Nonlabens sp. Asnod3-A02 TaxID=3160579 RepID=UPI003869F289